METIAVFILCLLPVLLIISRGLADISVGIISILFLIFSFTNRNWSWVRDPFLLGFLVIWGWLFVVSYFAVGDSNISYSRAIGWGRFIPFVFAIKYWLFANKYNVQNVLKVLFVVLSYVVVDTLIQRFFGVSIEGNVIENARRLTGPFDDLVVGTYMAKLGMIFLGGIFFITPLKDNKKTSVIIFSGIYIVTAVAILFSGERMALLCFLLSLLVFAIFAAGIRRYLLIMSAFVFLILSAIVVASPQVQEKFISSTSSILKNFWHSEYGVIYNNSYLMIKKFPITGAGLKNYRKVCLDDQYEQLRGRVQNCGLHSHNVYLEWAAEAGLVGLALFIGLMGWIIGSAIKAVRKIDGAEYYLGLGALTALIPFLWPIMSSMSLFSNWNAILFWYVVAWVFSYTPREQT